MEADVNELFPLCGDLWISDIKLMWRSVLVSAHAALNLNHMKFISGYPFLFS